MKGHGGKRDGAGRPPGTGTGATVRGVMVYLPVALIEELDAARGDTSRSAVISGLVQQYLDRLDPARSGEE